MKMLTSALSHNVKDWEKKKILDPSLYLDLYQNINEVYSGLRPILHLSFVEIHSVVFV